MHVSMTSFVTGTPYTGLDVYICQASLTGIWLSLQHSAWPDTHMLCSMLYTAAGSVEAVTTWAKHSIACVHCLCRCGVLLLHASLTGLLTATQMLCYNLPCAVELSHVLKHCKVCIMPYIHTERM